MTQKDIVRRLLDKAGQTYAEEAGIALADKPSPLYRTLVLAILLSTRIKADIAVAASRELHKAGMGTARAMADATWQQRVDALGKAGYRRYDEQTATALGEGAELMLREYSGDLRKLRAEADHDAEKIRERLTRFPRLGPTGAHIFGREAQLVWPELRPYLDKKALQGAERVGLPSDVKRLANLVGGEELATLSAALVRVALRPKLAEEIRAGTDAK